MFDHPFDYSSFFFSSLKKTFLFILDTSVVRIYFSRHLSSLVRTFYFYHIKMNTTNGNSSTELIRFDQQLRLVEQIVLGTIFILALIGNVLVLIVMLTTRHRRTTRMAFFILHLTIADLLVAFFSVLPMLIWKSTSTFFDGDFLCRLITFLMLTATYISVYT